MRFRDAECIWKYNDTLVLLSGDSDVLYHSMHVTGCWNGHKRSQSWHIYVILVSITHYMYTCLRKEPSLCS